MRGIVTGLVFAFVVFVVVSLPQARAQFPAGIGPGDTQNSAFANAQAAIKDQYRAKALEWKASWQKAFEPVSPAISKARDAYAARQYRQPALTQAQLNAYAAAITAAQASQQMALQRNQQAGQSFALGEQRDAQAFNYLAQGYYFYAGQKWYWCHSAGTGDYSDEHGFDELGNGPYPFASLWWAQGIDWCTDALARAAEAQAALSP